MREAPYDPAFVLTCVGDEKIPEPMINPTIRDKPLMYVSDLCFSSDAPFSSNGLELESPNAEYPAAVDESGKRFEAKSKAEETE